MKKGLVLEGGAMRGMFTAGATDVMMEANIEFDGAIGVSAGACFGCNYKSNQKGRALRYNLKYSKDPRYCSLRSLITTGDLYGAEFCYHEMPSKLDIFDTETYNNSPMEFYVVCTDIEKGETVYQKCDKADYEFLEWIRASASLPLVSRVVEIGNYKLLDGGITDPIPLRYFESIGYDRNVVILTQPLEYMKGENKMMPLIRIAMRKYPKLIDAMARRHELYNETTEYVKKREKQGDVLVIRPEGSLGISRTESDPEKLQGVYDKGKNITLGRLDEIRNFLE